MGFQGGGVLSSVRLYLGLGVAKSSHVLIGLWTVDDYLGKLPSGVIPPRNSQPRSRHCAALRTLVTLKAAVATLWRVIPSLTLTNYYLLRL